MSIEHYDTPSVPPSVPPSARRRCGSNGAKYGAHVPARDTFRRDTQASKDGDDRIYTADELEFMTAMDRYKRVNRRPYPGWSEVLGVLRALGYHKA